MRKRVRMIVEVAAAVAMVATNIGAKVVAVKMTAVAAEAVAVAAAVAVAVAVAVVIVVAVAMVVVVAVTVNVVAPAVPAESTAVTVAAEGLPKKGELWHRMLRSAFSTRKTCNPSGHRKDSRSSCMSWKIASGMSFWGQRLGGKSRKSG